MSEQERVNSGGGMGNLPFTREQLQAAYALNLCTVSVSQILAYNDMAVLNQEYDLILNNLNLENMPGDEALLQVLKRILETVAYFRIAEGEKDFIEKEYQQKMKNAIWTAVPNLALLVAGANPVSMGVSLASQIGIGYMNYRKNRSTYAMEKERQQWKLQRAAMEQLEGLSQQLFETAWRLADAYHFPDAFRLSRRQLDQYNAILMDEDEVRKYERLDSIKEQFAAYPPFWYYFGNAAASIAADEDLGLLEEQREAFREKARKYFEYFCQSGDLGLLREDEITATCCLEYAELLDGEKDREKILSLLDKAAKHAGSFWDVRELLSIAYLKQGENEKAAMELRRLVNEDYNAVVNAQLLSAIYAKDHLEELEEKGSSLALGGFGNSLDSLSRYQLLASRVGKEFLFPLPEGEEEKATLQSRFVLEQRKILKRMYTLVINSFRKKYASEFNRLIPLPREDYFGAGASPSAYSNEDIYEDCLAARQERIDKVKLAMENPQVAAVYKQEMYALPYTYQVIGILNRLFGAAVRLECVQDEVAKEELMLLVKRSLHENREKLQAVEDSLKSFDLDAYVKSQEITLDTLTGPFFKGLLDRAALSAEAKSEMVDFAIAESFLVHFCNEEGLKAPATLYRERHDVKEGEAEVTFFTPDLLGEDMVKESDRQTKNARMIALVKEMADQVVISKEQVEFYTQEDVRMNRYFYNKALQAYTGLRFKTLAVLDDRSRHDYDLLFTFDGVIPVIRGKVRTPVSFSEICWTNNARKKELKIGNVKFTSDHLDMDVLYKLLNRLAENA
ncbi:MAG: hypothetical protein IIZ39_06495 [Blautia sp.]|nr:hypothetical protein [Blautia sp.]